MFSSLVQYVLRTTSELTGLSMRHAKRLFIYFNSPEMSVTSDARPAHIALSQCASLHQ